MATKVKSWQEIEAVRLEELPEEQREAEKQRLAGLAEEDRSAELVAWGKTNGVEVEEQAPPPEETPEEKKAREDAEAEKAKLEKEREKEIEFQKWAKEKGYVAQDAVQGRIDELTTRIKQLEGKGSDPGAGGDKGKPKTFDQLSVDELYELRLQFNDAKSESYNPAYIQAIDRRLITLQAEAVADEKIKKTITEAEGRAAKGQVWQKLVDAYPDLKDPSSKLYIAAKQTYDSDPWMQGSPRGQRVAVEEAAEALGIKPAAGRPGATRKETKEDLTKTALAGAGRKGVGPSGDSVLAKLEAAAIKTKTGSPEWRAYFAELRKQERLGLNKKKE